MPSGSLLLIGPLQHSGPISGQAVCFQMLLGALRERKASFSVVDIMPRMAHQTSNPTFGRAFEHICIIPKLAAGFVRRPRVVYFTAARSFHGFLRDAIIVWLGSLVGARVIAHVHGGDFGVFYKRQLPAVGRFVSFTYKRVERIIVLGEKLRHMFDFDNELMERVRVVQNGLPCLPKTTLDPKELPNANGGPVRILYLSNMIESKGYLTLLEAVSLLRERAKFKIECHFCGEFMSSPDDVEPMSAEQHRKRFECFVSEHRLTDIVTFLNRVTGQEKDRELSEAHFVVLPTRYSAEGQPVSLIEGMAFGNVIISTDYRSIPDIVVHGKTGFLVPYAQPQAIADAIQKLVNDPRRYGEMSLASIRHFEDNFTRKAHLDRILRFLAARP